LSKSNEKTAHHSGNAYLELRAAIIKSVSF
jgi:hypothetical protein